MSSLAFYASPFEDSSDSTPPDSGQDRKKISRGKTIKRRPNPHVAAMIEHIHESTGTKQAGEHHEGEDNMGEFQPPEHPVSERTAEQTTSDAPKLAPKPYAGGDVPVGPVTVEGFDSAIPGPGPGNHSSPHPYVPYYTAVAGSPDKPQGAASLHGDEQERRDSLMKKLDYMMTV